MKKRTTKYPDAKPGGGAEALRETAVLENPLSINVRAAKDSFSSLLERAAQGLETIITSDGEPKAKLVPVEKKRKPFRVDWELLRSIPICKGARPSEDLIREERDSRD
ncbi:MAG: type II toxin-antitoxin system prevent-host-death family antitoxin [Verrucomicrobiota bacterium]|nr:type II toxin-antitoxin system prevent-host-death family antitoxin [Verrucomicrobiota bacterium]